MQTLVKQPGESRLYTMRFGGLLEGGATSIVSVTSYTASPSGLTMPDSPAVVGSDGAQRRISGGTDGDRYKITVRAVDNLGNTLEAEGFLQVRDI